MKGLINGIQSLLFKKKIIFQKKDASRPIFQNGEWIVAPFFVVPLIIHILEQVQKIYRPSTHCEENFGKKFWILKILLLFENLVVKW